MWWVFFKHSKSILLLSTTFSFFPVYYTPSFEFLFPYFICLCNFFFCKNIDEFKDEGDDSGYTLRGFVWNRNLGQLSTARQCFSFDNLYSKIHSLNCSYKIGVLPPWGNDLMWVYNHSLANLCQALALKSLFGSTSFGNIYK